MNRALRFTLLGLAVVVGVSLAFDAPMSASSSPTGRVKGRVTPEGGHTWSPDARVIATPGTTAANPVTGKSSQIYVVPVNGGMPRQLTKAVANTFAQSPQWQPQGDKIAYYVEQGRFGRKASLAVTSSRGGRQTLIVANRETLGFSWSPTGSRLAYDFGYGKGGITVVKPDGSGRRSVVDAIARDSSYSWSPNGSQIAFAYPGGGIGVARVGGGRRRLTDTGEDPSWSPTGELIAYIDGTDLKLIGANRGGARTVIRTLQGLYTLSWSPDGRKLSFQAVADSPLAPDLHVIDMSGSGDRVLASGVLTWDWRADSRLLAYAVSVGVVRVTITTVRPDGTGRHVIGDGGNPIWAPRGQRLAFLVVKSLRTLSSGLCITDADGGRRVCPLPR